jgi:hypothetical protein
MLSWSGPPPDPRRPVWGARRDQLCDPAHWSPLREVVDLYAAVTGLSLIETTIALYEQIHSEVPFVRNVGQLYRGSKYGSSDFGVGVVSQGHRILHDLASLTHQITDVRA